MDAMCRHVVRTRDVGLISRPRVGPDHSDRWPPRVSRRLTMTLALPIFVSSLIALAGACFHGSGPSH
jgi:hypothetical protein